MGAYEDADKQKRSCKNNRTVNDLRDGEPINGKGLEDAACKPAGNDTSGNKIMSPERFSKVEKTQGREACFGGELERCYGCAFVKNGGCVTNDKTAYEDADKQKRSCKNNRTVNDLRDGEPINGKGLEDAACKP